MIKMRVDTFLRFTSSKTADMNGNIALQIFEMCAKYPKVWGIHGQIFIFRGTVSWINVEEYLCLI